MALNRLQIRRDTLIDFQNSTTAPVLGEPTLVNEESRIRIAGPNATALGRVPVALPATEGSQFHSLWNARSFGDGPALVVPAFSGKTLTQNCSPETPAVEPVMTAFSAPLPNGFANDAGTVHLQASGDFLCGSTDPNMVFGFMIGDMEETTATLVGPDPGSHLTVQGVKPFLGGTGPYLTVGTGSGMPNVLGDYNKPVLWNLDAKICFLGKQSISPFKTSQSSIPEQTAQGTAPATAVPADHSDRVIRPYDSDFSEVLVADEDNANIRVFGTLTIMDPFVMYGGNRAYMHAPAAVKNGVVSVSQATHVLCDWGMFSSSTSTEYPTVLPRGKFVSCNGVAYESMGEVPGEDYSAIEALPDGSLANLASKVDRLSRAHRLAGIVSPGVGSRWERWFRPTKTVLEFSFEEHVPHATNPGQFLKLKVGGPLQSDPDETYELWDNSEAGPYYGPQGTTWPRLGASGDYSALAGGLFPGRLDEITAAANLDVCRVINGAEYVPRLSHERSTAAQFSTTNDNFVDQHEQASTVDTVYYSNPQAASNADGEWNCYWRRLADDRADKMRIHHSTAFAFGGRFGTNDYLPF